jgi:hypothetical protein
MEREFLNRQISILEGSVNDYRKGRISLDGLIKRIEGISSAIGDPEFRNTVYPIVVSLEQINAALLSGQPMMPSFEAIVRGDLEKLDAVIASMSAADSSGRIGKAR